jgi:hypothetical protein
VIYRSGPTEGAIAEHAYQLYLAAGCPEGKALQHWLAAEEKLLRETAETPEQRLLRVATIATWAMSGFPAKLRQHHQS